MTLTRREKIDRGIIPKVVKDERKEKLQVMSERFKEVVKIYGQSKS